MSVWNLWGREPAMVVAGVQAILGLLLSFGLQLTTEQVGAILALTAVALGLITRTQVTSPATMEKIARGEIAVEPK